MGTYLSVLDSYTVNFLYIFSTVLNFQSLLIKLKYFNLYHNKDNDDVFTRCCEFGQQYKLQATVLRTRNNISLIVNGNYSE